MIFQEACKAVPVRLKRPLIIALAIGLVILNQGLLFLSQQMQRVVSHSGQAIPVNSMRMLITAVVASIFLFGLSPLPWQWTGDRKLMAKAGRGLAQALALNLAYVAISFVINWSYAKQQFLQATPQLPDAARYAAFAFGAMISIVFYTGVGFALALWETRTTEKMEAQRQADEARWTLLKAQMSPHVLLNSLNGLAELVREDANAASKGMRDLAEVYRQLLVLGEAPKIPLGQERRLLERYLDVEALRLGERLKVDWDWDPALDDELAMPLLIQPLVENAIKHGVAADPAGGIIRIEARRDDTCLRLCVSNTGRAPLHGPRKGTGVGLRNLKSRLELAYGKEACFDLVQEQPWMRAELRLPLEVKA